MMWFFQVGDHGDDLVAADFDAGEIERRVGQSEDVGATSAIGFDFPEVSHDMFLQELFDQFGDGRNADVQLFREIGQGALS